MRATSQLERAEAVLKSILSGGRLPGEPTLIIFLVPVFFKEFLVNIKDPTLCQAFGNFYMSMTGPNFTAPDYTLDGLKRRSTCFDVKLGRRGTITLRAVIASVPHRPPGTFHFYANVIDVILRAFMKRAQILCQAATIPRLCCLALPLRPHKPLPQCTRQAFHKHKLLPASIHFLCSRSETCSSPLTRLFGLCVM